MDTTLLSLFLLFFLFRYTRTIIGIFAFCLYKPKLVRQYPSYVPSRDVTVIVPTTCKSLTTLTRCLASLLVCSPAAVMVIAVHKNVPLIQHICDLNSFKNVRVLGVDRLNKRQQMIVGLTEVETDLLVFADDDVFWPTNRYLECLIAIFEDPTTGAGGTRQRVCRGVENAFGLVSIWNFLATAYLERRVWNNIATNAIDGSISTLSGRTAAYRTKILKNDKFFQYFLNDQWRSRPLNTDDDKALTRFVYSHGWNIIIQSDPNAVIKTTMEESLQGYVAQCLR